MSTNQNLCGMNAADFQKEVDGKKTDLFILKNAKGYEVAITNYGGALVAIMVPDKDGNIGNVIQGHDNIDEVITSPEPYLSTLIGRYGNRICKGKFTLDGKEYSLAINNGPNALHGGPTGFPGKFEIEVVYTWTDDCELVIDYKGTTDKKTIVNMTHHGYFSIAGIANPTPTVDDLICEINDNHYVPIDDTSIPLGTIDNVKGTPFDFTTPKPVGKDIDADDIQIKNGAGYDHCFVLNKKEPGELSFAARISDPKSGRTMEVYTTEPGVQVYTDNWATGYPGQHGATFPRRSAICFEAQRFPDSPNRPYFPSAILNPGEVYTQKTIYKFGVIK